MSTERDLPGDVNRVVRSWLREDRHEDADHVLGAVLDELDATPQRRSTPWTAWRDLFMNNNVVRVGLVAAAAVIIAVIAINLLPGSPAPGGESTPSPSAAASAASEATATPGSAEFSVAIPGSGRLWTMTLPEGWTSASWYVTNGGSQSDSIFVGAYPVESVYGDPCQWEGSLPDPPVGPTVDDFATALVNQPTREGAMTDVTIDGFSGKKVTLSTPSDINFADCDLSIFGTWTEAGSEEPSRYSQGPGQLEDVYILDVDGVRAVLDASYFPERSAAADLAELEGLIASLAIEP